VSYTQYIHRYSPQTILLFALIFAEPISFFHYFQQLSSIPAGSDCRLGPPTVWRPRFFKFTGTPVCLLFSCFLVHLTNDSPGLSPPNEHQLQSGPPPAPQPVGAIVVCLPSSLFFLHFTYIYPRMKSPGNVFAKDCSIDTPFRSMADLYFVLGGFISVTGSL
jgi:hypothetical protein